MQGELINTHGPIILETDKVVIALWLSFAQNPTKAPRDGNGITWPLYQPGQEKMVVFAEDGENWFQLKDESINDNQCRR